MRREPEGVCGKHGAHLEKDDVDPMPGMPTDAELRRARARDPGGAFKDLVFDGNRMKMALDDVLKCVTDADEKVAHAREAHDRPAWLQACLDRAGRGCLEWTAFGG